MVRLRRGESPAQLERRKSTWTERWVRISRGDGAGDWATLSAKKAIAFELRRMAHRKCAFCEGKLELTAYLEIEHYWPKTIRPEQAFDWHNLFPICRICNNTKSDIDHGGMLIKPDVEDPEPFLWLNPDTGKLEASAAVSDAERGRIKQTFELCDLQRGTLCDERIETMEATIHWLERVAERQGGLDARLRKEWVRLTAPLTPYKFVIRHVFRTRGEPRLAAYDRRLCRQIAGSSG